MANILNGIELSRQMRNMVADMCRAFEEKYHHTVGLAIIQVGDNPASTSYVKNNLRLCKEVGISAYHHKLSAKTSEADIIALIDRLNADENVSGILLQLPLPEGISLQNVAGRISPTKDVDGLNPLSAGNLYMGYPAFAPCTPSGVLELLKSTKTELPGKHAVIVGAGGLGRALVGYGGFKNYGLNIVAAFDSSPELIGKKFGGVQVYDAADIARLVRRMNVKIGIIAVPQGAAQQVADELIGGGVRAIWNFAPANLNLPTNIAVKNEDMAASLAILSMRLAEILNNEK